MSLYKQTGSDVWYVNISHPGHPRVRRSTGATDRTEAQRIHDEIKASLWSAPKATGKTWGDAVILWCSAATRSDSELLSLTKFSRTFPDRALSAVTPEAIDTALSFCKSPGTYTRYRTMLAAILNLSGVKLKLTSRRAKKKVPRIWLTHEQWSALYAELPAHMKSMAEFSIETGLRQANVLQLRWSQVNLARRVVTIEAAEMKSNAALSVPLSDTALAVLTAKQGEHAEFVFTYRGRAIKEIKTAFQSACVRAGVGKLDAAGHYVGFTWHGFRHTWATWHVQNGTPLDVLQRLGGWSDLRMVLNYAHHSPGYLSTYANNTKAKT